MDFRELSYITAIAKYQNITKAAESLYISQPTLSKFLKALEEDQLPWLQVIDEFPIPHTPAKVATLYAIPYLPTLMLIDPDGKIVGKAKDKHELKTWLDERLAKKK